MGAVPRLDGRRDPDRVRLGGDLPSPLDPPPGCRFHPRCPFATDACRTTVPPERDLGAGRSVACHHFPEAS